MRQRDYRFCQAFADAVADGCPERDAAIRAYRESHSTRRGYVMMSEKSVLKAAEAKLGQGVIREEIAAYVQRETGLSVGDVLRLEAEFVRGTKTETVVLRGGKNEPDALVEKPISAALQLRAIDGYKKLAFVPATQHVKIDAHATLSAVAMDSLGASVPMMSARELDVTPMPGATRLPAVTIENDDEEPEL